jgi:hypothetical protein
MQQTAHKAAIAKMTHAWARRYAIKIAAGTPLSAGEMRKLCHITGKACLLDFGDPRYPTNCNYDDACALFTLIHQFKPEVCEAQAIKGLGWLRNVARTPSGARRGTKAAAQFSEADIRRVLNLALQVQSREPGAHKNKAWGFNLVDVYLPDWKGATVGYPIYRLFAGAQSFDYYTVPWQAVGEFKIVRHASA